MLIYTDNFYNDEAPHEELVSDDALKAIVCGYIDHYAAKLREGVTGYVSPQETSSWVIKLAEAEAILAGGTGTIIPIEAQARGVSVEDIANRVIVNSQAFKQVEGFIAGTAGMHKDTVRALTTRQEIIDYDWRDGWNM